MGDNLAIIPLWVTPQDDQSHTDDRHQHPQMEDLGSDLRDTQNGVVQITSENIEAIAAEMQNLTERSSERAKIMKRLRAQIKREESTKNESNSNVQVELESDNQNEPSLKTKKH